MSDSLGFALAVVFAQVVPAAIFFYASYWALSIRRALMSHIYRRLALWVSAVAALFGFSLFLTYTTNPAIYAVFGFFTYSPNPSVDAVFGFYYAALVVISFAFVDSLIPVARRSDPLIRGVIRWEKLRVVLWAVVGGTAALAVLMFVFASSLASTAFLAAGGGVFGVSGIAVSIGWHRSRDPVLRTFLKWLSIDLVLIVFYVLTYAAVSGVPGVTTFDAYFSYAALPAGAITILAGYASYREARALAPMNRLQPLSVAETTVGTSSTHSAGPGD